MDRVSFELIEHTADVRIRVRAASLEELFRQALRATMSLLQPAAGQRTVDRQIAIGADDRTTLLIDFLNDALSRAHVDREAYDEIVFSRLTETRVEAQLIGKEALSFGDDVKAVTYHEADVVRDPTGMWQTIIVYDI